MTLNVDTLFALASARGLSKKDLGARADIPESQLEQILAEPEGARIGDLDKLANTLGVHELVLHAPPAALSVGIMPDFRRPGAELTPLTPEAYRAIDTAYAIRGLLSDTASAEAIHVALASLVKNLTPKAASEVARKEMDLSFEQQIESPRDSAFYALLRLKVEQQNISVLQESYSNSDGAGFTISDGSGPAIIVVNTRGMTYGRRSFTLMHEMYHVLLGETGVSSPFSGTVIEKRCDEFAENFLLPETEFRALIRDRFSKVADFFDVVPRIARLLKVSQQAVALRIDKLKVQPGLYNRWVSQYKGRINPDFDKKAGGSPVEPEVVKLAKYGFHFAKIISRAIESKKINYIGLYRLSGLKRDYAARYFSYADRISSSSAQVAVLEM